MFAKTIISLGFLFIMLLGLLLAIQDQQYILFAIGIGGYFLVAISAELCKCYRKLL
jgi:heme O synthase-like polyprenyltransferase